MTDFFHVEKAKIPIDEAMKNTEVIFWTNDK